MRIVSIAAVAVLSSWAAAQAQPITTGDLQALDTDGNGKVNQAEFDAFLDAAFAKLDANGDGYITVKEATVVMTPEQFAAANANGDGGLSRQEFKVAAQKDFTAADSDGDGLLN